MSRKKFESFGRNHFMFARMASNGPLSEEEYERRNRRNKKITWDEYEYSQSQLYEMHGSRAQHNAGAT
jgi:hypothetical protein